MGNELKTFQKSKWWYLNYLHQSPVSALLRAARKVLHLFQPNRPSLAFGAVGFLEEAINNKSIIIEWGSGRSTLWFYQRVKQVISIESDKSWFDFVRKKLPPQGIISYEKEKASYINVGCSKVSSANLILIDGKHREECFTAAWQRAGKDTWIVLDDFNRTEYRSWLKKFPEPTHLFQDPWGVFSTAFWKKA